MDLGERVAELEQQNAKLEQQLLQAQRLTALGELVSTTTHEFNNVLTTIINYAKMGIRHRDAATRDKALTKILSAGERAARITNSVLGAARNRSDRFGPIALDGIINESLVLLERELSKYRIAVDLQIAENLPPVYGVGNQIQQVLLNLLINARQAMPRGGSVCLRVVHTSDSPWVELEVRDTGKGIPAEQLPHIFDSFYSTKDGPDDSGKGGTGLGLAACRTIVENHRGRIRVGSTVGKGTSFSIKLPVHSEPGTPDVAPASVDSASRQVVAPSAG